MMTTLAHQLQYKDYDFPYESSASSAYIWKGNMPEMVQLSDGLAVDITHGVQRRHPIHDVDDQVPSIDVVTDEDRRTLKHVADKIPVQVWYVILISTAERFAFFGFREPFRKSTPTLHTMHLPH